jgi:hypothetical protein
MRMKLFFGVSIVLLLPLTALAAGFAKQSLFLSQSTVSQGETVFIYAVVENDTQSAFSGTLKFADANGPIGSTPVSLNSGAAATVSVSWKPTAGEHDVTANLTTTDGAVVESEDSKFLIQPTPFSTSAAATQSPDSESSELSSSTTVESSKPIEQWVASTSPFIANYTAPILSTIDSGRTVSAAKLQTGNEWAEHSLATSVTKPSSWLNTLWLITATAILYICSALIYVVENIGVFYPLFAVIFFFLLSRLYRFTRR